ncbi:MAG: hypothetical protein WC783_00245 [Candidatus Paceibacterota bacterium]|jgi:hypothetical protein
MYNPKNLNVEEENDINNQLVCRIDGKDVTRGDLLKAFNKVCDPKDWKAQISAWVNVEDIPITLAAIEFFTATKGSYDENLDFVNYVQGITTDKMVRMHLIKADGYRLGPAE